jgi:hypothetical protein
MFSNFYSHCKVLLFSILALLLVQSCRNTGPKEPKVNPQAEKVAPPRSFDVNVFIENSGSMDGYLNASPSTFKDFLKTFCADVVSKIRKTPTINFVNSTNACAPPNQADIQKFINDLNLTTFKAGCPPGSSSNIDDVIKNATKGLDNSISIIVSDFILSFNGNANPSNPTNPSNASSTAKANLQTIISSLVVKDSISMVFMKLNANFTGTYFKESLPTNNILTTNINRPYYAISKRNAFI